jgi:uncharacterized protein (DUF2384 family)
MGVVVDPVLASGNERDWCTAVNEVGTVLSHKQQRLVEKKPIDLVVHTRGAAIVIDLGPAFPVHL